MDEPVWWKLLNVDSEQFERSRYAGESVSGKGKFRLKDLNILRKIAPHIYESAAGEVKEHNDYVFDNGGTKFKKLKMGKKIGSIPMWDAALHPELMNDPSAQKKYWQDHPEFKANG